MPRLRSATAGFTLIELMVVLALAGLMVGLVLPLGMKALENAARRGAQADLKAALSAYPLAAAHSGRAMVIDTAGLKKALPEWPEACALSVVQPLRYAANGMAGGGRVMLNCAGDAPVILQVAVMTGEVVLPSR